MLKRQFIYKWAILHGFADVPCPDSWPQDAIPTSTSGYYRNSERGVFRTTMPLQGRSLLDVDLNDIVIGLF